ncbi:hypothetical protein E2C01_027288 [Portunus trituberculatus]|uniref:Uncharacterized protein n=1 Tax=Portunus trituberculatus TaxID=210409 RepID=A0A5B7EL91_PORTR|nr:hypothetical protein [Portunus trituberculatus]
MTLLAHHKNRGKNLSENVCEGLGWEGGGRPEEHTGWGREPHTRAGDGPPPGADDTMIVFLPHYKQTPLRRFRAHIRDEQTIKSFLGGMQWDEANE